MTVVDKQDINLAALDLSDSYVVIIPPQNNVIPGVSTQLAGIVGTATRGPLNSPVVVSDMASLILNFGLPQTASHNLVTEAMNALRQGANRIICVRVADGTQAKATATLRDNAGTPATLVTLTSKYNGTTYNSLKATVSTGTNDTVAAPTWKVTLELPGEIKEVFDNIGGASGVLLAANIVSAINNGQGGVRGPSNYVTAATSYAGVATGMTAETRTFASGADGATTITKTQLLGTDGALSTRTGMYALRATGHRQFILSGLTDTTAWTDQVTFAKGEGSMAILTCVTGTDTNTFIANKRTAGIDDYHAAFVKDHVYINDNYNNVQRLVSPLGFALGRIAALSPEQSPGNKQLYGIVATERSRDSIPYSDAELSQLEQAGIIPITNPIPASGVFGLRHGKNSSSDPTRREISYTRMTNFIAYSLAAVLGQFVCQPHTKNLRRKAKNCISSFLAELQRLEMIGDPNDGPVYSVICDATNNPDSQVSLGYLNITAQVRYLSIANYVVVGLEGGQTVKPVVQEIRGAAA
jgi:phage tail sheath protein FI